MGRRGWRSFIADCGRFPLWRPAVLLALLLLGSAGCSIVPVNVSNPIPGMTKVAVAPFINLSADMSVDGRRFAIAYYDELQKTANYEVVPIGIVELAIRENNLALENPADVIRLAENLDVDAVVVGAITEYVPYYPPQMGVHINWYSPRGWLFASGDQSRRSYDPSGLGTRPPPATVPAGPVIRGQSSDNEIDDQFRPFPSAPPIRLTQTAGGSRGGANPETAAQPVWPPDPDPAASGVPAPRGSAGPKLPAGTFCPAGQTDNLRPVMSYTRFFDGASPELVHRLRCYYARRGDMRSGGWEAYLHRSDDFLRFTAHVLVMEMLALHGGTLTTEKVFLFGN